jgi:valyl-tRNA synthetase
VKAGALFITKLWNIARFISSFPVETEDYELAPLDKMVLAQLNDLIKECRGGYDELDFYVPSNAVRIFAWNVFADHYVEAAKSRAYNQRGEFDVRLQRGAWFTLHACLSGIIRLLAPICPFVTDVLWRELYSSESVHLQMFPELKEEWDDELKALVPVLAGFDAAVWRYKKEKGVALSQELDATIYAPEELKAFEADLKAMHKIRRIMFESPSESVRAKAKVLDSDTFAAE